MIKIKEKLTLSVIIPVYNEDKAIGVVIDKILSARLGILKKYPFLKDIEIIIVDDGSTDNSKVIIKDKIKGHNSIAIISHKSNQGYGAALKTGFGYAIGDFILFFDGDNTFDFYQADKLLNDFFSEDLDVAVGNRFTKVNKMPFIRKIGNKFFSAVIFLLTGKCIADPNCGIRIFKKNILSNLEPLPDDLNFIIVFTVRILLRNMKWKVCFVPYDKRVGQSKLNVINHGIKFLRSLMLTIREERML